MVTKSSSVNDALLIKMFEDISQELYQIVIAYNPLLFLGCVSFSSALYTGSRDPAFLPRHVVYLHNFIWKYASAKTWDLTDPPPEIIQKVMDLMEQLMHISSLVACGFIDHAKLHDVKHEILGIQKLQNLHITGKGYPIYRQNIFLSICDQAKLEQLTTLSITGRQILNFMHDVEHLIETRCVGYDIKKKALLERNRNVSALTEQERELLHTDLKLFVRGYAQTELFDISDIYDKYPQIFAVFSNASKTCANADFQCKESLPGKEAQFLQKPILKIKDRYYLFVFQSFEDNLFALYLDYLQRYSPKAAEKLKKARDNFVESKSFELIKKTMQATSAWQNLRYDYEEEGEKRQGETDGIILIDDILIVIEAKAHLLKLSTLRGASKSFPEQMNEIIGKADSQADRLIRTLAEKKKLALQDEKGTPIITLDLKHLRDVKKIIVLYDDLSPQLAQLYRFQDSKILNFVEWPWVVALHDLMAICHILDNPALFFLYLERRIALNKHPECRFHDEMEILGHFLKYGLFFENNDTQNTQFVGMDAEVDAYFKQQSEKPSYPLPARLHKFINRLILQKPYGWLNIAKALVSFDKKVLEEIDKIILLSEINCYPKAGDFSAIRASQGGAIVILICVCWNNWPLHEIINKMKKVCSKYADCMSISAVVWNPFFELSHLVTLQIVNRKVVIGGFPSYIALSTRTFDIRG